MKKNHNSSKRLVLVALNKTVTLFRSALVCFLFLFASNILAQNITTVDNNSIDELFERLNEIGNYAGSISDFFTEEELLLLKTHMSIKQKGTTQNFKWNSGTTAWCAMNQTNEFGTFDTSDGSTVNAIGPSPAVAETAGAINPTDPSTAWVLDYSGDAYTVDVATGTYTFVGNISISDDFDPNWNGAEFDPTTGLFYAISGSTDELYVINVPCLSSTLIGSIAVDFLIALAIDGNGDAYSYSISTDSLYSIDLDTGASTLIGPIGFNANFGQGMFWDSASDTVFMTAYHVDSPNQELRAELRSVNTTTGATTLINTMDGDLITQYAWASTPFTGVPPSCTQPLNLLASNVTANTADLTWCQEATAALGYEWVVMPSGVPPVIDGSTEVATNTTNSLTTEDSVAGLNSDTTYDAYVRSVCSASETSDWSLVESFTTASVFVNVIVQDITVQLDVNGEATITPAMLDNGSSADAGIDSLSLDITDFDCGDIGDNSVTLTVTDIDGNFASATALVTVEDSLAPTALTQDITVDLAGNPSVSISPEDVNNGSFDNCSDVTLSIDEDTFTTIGDFPVVLTVEDELGNTSSVTVIVTVEDTMGIVDNDIQKVEITVYPSPAEKLLYFETNINILSYSIYDLFGKTVIDEANTNDQVNVELLADGVYFIKFNLHDDKYRIRKFVKR